MGRIEEIQNRADNYKNDYLPYFNNNGEMHEWNVMYGDLLYLISRLQIAEEENQKLRESLDKAHVLLDRYENMLP